MLVDLLMNTDYNVKIEGKIPSISSLATKSALTAVENKIPDVSSLIKKQIMTQNIRNRKENS